MKRPTGTRKCGCLFKLRANPYKSDGLWRVKVVCGVHNHARAESLLGHAYADRLTKEEVSVVHDMVDNRVKPSHVLLSLKDRRPENLTTIQQIYNASGRYKKVKRGDYTEMQHLMSLLERDKYVFWHRMNQETNVVEDVFWSHPGAIELFNLFPTVVLLDSTYKTNRYGIPLLEMVGVTSTDVTFTIGFAYMSSEKLFNVVWALRKHLYKNLCGHVSKKVLQLICTENTRVKRVGVEKRACGCLMRITHGIPCACELARYTCVLLQSVHDIWKRLSWATVEVKDEDLSFDLNLKSEFEALTHKFEEANIPTKRALKEKLRELAFPDSTSMCPPLEKLKTKGMPKGQPIGSTKRDSSYHEYVDNYINSLHDSNSTMGCNTRPTPPVPKWSSPQGCNATKPRKGRGRPKKTQEWTKDEHQQILISKMPALFQPHIDHVLDVVGDGNCGYRAIAALLGMGEHVWHEIRHAMIDELTARAAKYAQMHGPARSQIILDALTLAPKEIACPDKWLTIPDMGYIVATAFSVVFVTLAPTGCSTYLPLAGAPPKKHQIICLGHVYGNHWIQVFLKDDHLMPQTGPQWIHHYNPEALEWETPYQERMEQFRKILEDQHRDSPIVLVDLTED